MENNNQTYHLSAAEVWQEFSRLWEKTGGNSKKTPKYLPGMLRRLGLPQHKQMVETLFEIAEEIEKTRNSCMVCCNVLVRVQTHPTADVVAGAEELLKHSAAADSEKITRSRGLDETLQEHDELAGEGE